MLFSCDKCSRWMHGDCAGITTQDEADNLETFLCYACQGIPIDLQDQMKPVPLKRPAGRLKRGMIWDPYQGVIPDPSFVDDPKPAKKCKPPSSSRLPVKEEESSDDDDKYVHPTKTPKLIHECGRSSRACPNLIPESPKPQAQSLALDAQYWYHRMRKKVDVSLSVGEGGVVAVKLATPYETVSCRSP